MDVSWTIKKAECWRIGFELWCWRRLLTVPWTARWSDQSILKENSPEYSLEELMLKLKLPSLATWCEELTHWKSPLLGKIEGGRKGRREWDGWMASQTQWTWVWVGSRSQWWTGKRCASVRGIAVRHDLVTELNWRKTFCLKVRNLCPLKLL